MTIRSRELLAVADVVVVDVPGRAALVAAWAAQDVLVVDGRHGEHGEELTLAARARLLVATAENTRSGGLVVRLMDGDPSLFHGFAEEALALRRAGIGFEVVPGVSSVTAAPTYAGVPLTCARASTVHVVHAGLTEHDWSWSCDPSISVVVMGPPARMATALDDFVAAGRPPDTPVAIIESGTTLAQTTRVSTLGAAGAILRSGVVAPPALVVAGPQVGMREALSWFDVKPLFGWRVLVPTTKDDLGPAISRLAIHGAVTTVVPTIAVEPPRTPQQMDRAVRGLVTGRYAWVGFSSANAARAVLDKVGELGLDARALAGVQVAAVGSETVAVLRRFGLAPDLVPPHEQSMSSLLEAWPEFDEDHDPLERVLLPRADIATDTLAAGLADLGWEVDDVTAYRTVRAAPPSAHIREDIKAGAFDAVLFPSSATVRNLVGIAGKPHPQTVVACIGPQTAATAEELGLRVDVLAPQPTLDALVDTLAAHGGALAAASRAAGMPVRRPSERRHAARRRAR